MDVLNRAPEVAVIMPAYNAEKYIAGSVRSVLGQSFKDLELIVVDDGSDDGTSGALRRLAREDGRLRAVTVPNGGPAAARNRGLRELRPGTRYVMFVDSDDELLPGALESAVSAMSETGADMALLSFAIGDKDYSERRQFIDRAGMGEAFPRLYKANLLNQAWAKLFRAELLSGPGGVRFQDLRWGEDRLFIFDCLERAESVLVLPDRAYRYTMHGGESLINSYYDSKFSVCLLADSRAGELAEAFGSEDLAPLRYMFAKSVFSCFTTLFSPSCPLDRAGRREKAREMLAEERLRLRCRDTREGLPTELLCAVLRSGSVGLCLAVFRLVAWVGDTLPGLFIWLKHRK